MTTPEDTSPKTTRLSRRAVLGASAATAAAVIVGAQQGSTSAGEAHTGGSTMWTVRRAKERGHANHGWLDTNHTFSFANYYDPRHMGFGPLRVLNDDRVVGGAGFPKHPHRDMEIITYVVDGALEHKDTSGGGGVIRPGDVQHMTAGSGVWHSEYNASDKDGVRFLQIWVKPEKSRKTPTYNQKHFPMQDREGKMVLVASPDGDAGSIAIGQDVKLLASVLGDGDSAARTIAPGRKVWVQVARGEIAVGDTVLREGDGAWAEDPGEVKLVGKKPGSEVLTFDIA
jgi:redox-sensitive bicupin YhaK (pirin superfamily)